MPRHSRIVLPGCPMHVIHRGNNRVPLFLEHEDRTRFVRMLREASARALCAIHAYVLMTNHVHLVVTPATETGPAVLMQTLGRRYVRWFNDRHDRTGTLWEGRYRSSPIATDAYLFACCRYVELNPVRAGLVARPEEYRWSSYRRNAHGGRDSLVTPHDRYEALGSCATEREASYRAMFTHAGGGDVGPTIRRARVPAALVDGAYLP